MITNNSYYIHISSENVPHYFSLGLICPAVLIENRIKDVQNNFCYEILMSQKKWDKSLDCSIECTIIDESNLIELGNGYYSYRSFIPVSRIKKIYFSNKKMMDNIVWSTNETAAYLPDNLFQFEKKLKENTSIIKADYAEVKTVLDSDLNKNIEKYNKIIGGFAFSKLLRNNYVDPNLTYSNSYFELYKTIQIEFEIHESDNSNYHNNFNGLFNNKEANWLKYKKHIDKYINNEYVINVALDRKIKLVEKFNIIKYDVNINDEEIYILIILATYGEGKPKSIEDFVNDLGNNAILAKFKENATILLGFHIGYKKIRNYYSISNNNIPVKFELVNQLDYYTIEHVFNYVNKEKDLYALTNYGYLISLAPEENIIDNVKYFGFYKCNSNIIISISPEFLSNTYIHDLIEKNAALNSNTFLEKYLFTIYKMVDLDDHKKISIEKLTYKNLREILETITVQLKNDYNNVIEKINIEIQQLKSENIKIVPKKNSKVNKKKNTSQTANNAIKLDF